MPSGNRRHWWIAWLVLCAVAFIWGLSAISADGDSIEEISPLFAVRTASAAELEEIRIEGTYRQDAAIPVGSLACLSSAIHNAGEGKAAYVAVGMEFVAMSTVAGFTCMMTCDPALCPGTYQVTCTIPCPGTYQATCESTCGTCWNTCEATCASCEPPCPESTVFGW